MPHLAQGYQALINRLTKELGAGNKLRVEQCHGDTSETDPQVQQLLNFKNVTRKERT